MRADRSAQPLKNSALGADDKVIMHDTTELQEIPAGLGAVGTLPPPPPVPVPPVPTPPNQISQASAPTLPSVAPPVPRPDNGAANPFASAMEMSWSTPSPTARHVKKAGGFRRGTSWLLVLAVIGGLAYGAITYGSDLMELATGDESIDEPVAPASFPVATAATPTIRTATFEVERPDALNGPQRYAVTTDFETGISRVVVERTDVPNLEVLTLWDQAFIRRADQPTWYQLDRGQFPIGAEFGVARWIRSLDQMLPAALRESAVIERATESTVADVATKRLLVTLDPNVITLATATPPAPPANPDGSLPPAPQPTVALPPGVVLQPASDPEATLTMELWIDDAGIVRKSILPVELGAETITVTSLSPEGWEPIFPTPENIAPLTATALFQLGL
jgi:hypothetical protein